MPSPVAIEVAAHHNSNNSGDSFGNSKKVLNRASTIFVQPPRLGQKSTSFKNKTDQQIDLCIFHSAPLIKKDRDVILPLADSTLDFEVERRLILDTLKRNEIGADIRFDAATTEKLVEVLDS